MKNIDSNIWKLYVIKALRWFMLIIPVVVLFWQENGLTMQQILILQSLFSLGVIIFEVPSGYFSDVMGRKYTMVWGCVLGSLGFLIYSFSYGFWGFLGAELILGLATSFISGTDSAILYDTLLQGGRQHKYKLMEGRMLSAGNFSEGIASFIGGFIALISLRTPLVIETVLMFLSIPIALSLIEPQRHKHLGARGPVKEILSIIQFSVHQNREIKWLIAYAAFIGASTLVMVWLIQPYFKLVGLPLAWFGIAWGFLQFSVGIFSLLSHRFERSLGRKNTLIFLVLVTFCGYLLLSMFHHIAAIAFIVIFYFVRGIAGPLLKEYINIKITSDMRATVLSVKNMASRLAFAIIGPFVGWVTDAYSLQTAFLVSGCLFLFCLCFTLVFLQKYKALT